VSTGRRTTTLADLETELQAPAKPVTVTSRPRARDGTETAVTKADRARMQRRMSRRSTPAARTPALSWWLCDRPTLEGRTVCEAHADQLERRAGELREHAENRKRNR
jgi:hypothetical protein